MLATIRKEFLLLIRDPGGLLLLLIMPAALIIVMAIVQNAPYESFKAMQFDLLFVNKDKGFVGQEIKKSLEESANFNVVTEVNNQLLDSGQVHQLLKEGEYKFALIVPASATKAIINATNEIANKLAKSRGIPSSLPTNHRFDQATLQLLIDPVTKPSLSSALQFALNEYTGKIKMEILMRRLAKLNGVNAKNDSVFSLNRLVRVLSVTKQNTLGNQPKIQAINSVQHNVPAWAIFGMFMIVVPISGNMIRERDEGSALRIKLIPNATVRVAIGKVLFYILVCLFQFLCMMLVGIYIIPFFGLPALELGRHLLALALIAVAISMVAVGYGYFIGSIFRTANQAMPFGAISVVLFSALGGIWVPTEILPNLMQSIALFSPLNWCLEGINQVILRQSGISSIIGSVLLLAGLGITLTLLPLLFRKKF